MIRLYKTRSGAIVERDGVYALLATAPWDELINRDDLATELQRRTDVARPGADFRLDAAELLPPVGSQEVWAAGVTYRRSRNARREESQAAGGGDFYDRVYHAERPELFFKASPHRVAGHLQNVRIRQDSCWNVPEPELTLVITSSRKIVGYTIGNDMSSRDIEGENPLYLPQAKVYDRSCALGPGILVSENPLPGSTSIAIQVSRSGQVVFNGGTLLSEMKKPLPSLVEYLFRDNTFPHGCFLLTGTGVVPPSTFSLLPGDLVRITIEPIGTLENRVGDVG